MLTIYSKLLLSLFLYTGLHPLHVSTTELSFNAKAKSVEVSCRIFTDDFERILAKNYQVKTDLTKAEKHKDMDVLIKKYMESWFMWALKMTMKPRTCIWRSRMFHH